MTVFSAGLNHKFETAADIEPKLVDLVDGVRVVNLGGNSYGVGACEALAEKFTEISTLEVANLDDMFTGRLRAEIPQSLDAMLTALLNCPSLHTINLSDNAFGIATIDPLEKFFSNHTPLRHLILANNGFGPEAGARIGKALEKLAAKKRAENHPTPLETVICGRNRLENGSMEAWAKFLKAHGTIKELRLYQNGIRKEGIEMLMTQGLRFSPHLVALDIQDNTFTGQGVGSMIDVMDSWDNIKEITISDCLLSKEGSLAFAQKVKSADNLKGLETLRLQYNDIDQQGLKHLADAVENKLTSLKLLELNGNCFSEDHEYVKSIIAVFSKRGYGELDELDDMEDEDEDEDEDEEEDTEQEQEQELNKDTQSTKPVEDQTNDQVKDKAVDDLAEKLAKTNI